MTDFDPVNNPSHYLEGRTIEPLEVIEDWDLDFHDGQVVKYVARAGRKDNEIQDLKKARFYLDRKIEMLEEAEPVRVGSVDGSIDGATITGPQISRSAVIGEISEHDRRLADAIAEAKDRSGSYL